MIRFEHVTITYPDATSPTVRDVDLTIDEGELCLVVGRTGVGKSTLLGAINGLVPHFTGGRLAGRVTVDGRDTSTHPPRELADVVGVVGQDPLAGFVTDTVEEELAYAMEQLALAPDVMRKRVEETLDLLGIAELRDRPLRTLSGGQQQRVAIGSVLTAHPRVLVLDEPTSALDPTASEEVLAAITRLVHDLGVTVVIAEHRLERVAQYADRVLYLHGDGTVASGTPTELFATSSVAPPVVRLGRLAGWNPLPLSVRDARRVAGPLRQQLHDVRPDPEAALEPAGIEAPGLDATRLDATGLEEKGTDTASETDAGGTAARSGTSSGRRRRRRNETSTDAPELRARKVVVRYDDVVAVRQVDLDLAAGEVVALMGRNGSGKSSLMWALQGAGERTSGSVDVQGQDPRTLSAGDARALVGLVPQTPTDLLYLATVDAECTQADTDSNRPAGTCRALLDRIVAGIDGEAHPRDLSEGQKLSLVLAVQLCASPRIVLLDEPTRGLDYHAKEHLTEVLHELAADGHAIVVSSHDVEFVASTADRVVVLADGEIVADGPTADVVVASPAFAPQVAKILNPEPWLTVDQVAAALAAAPTAAQAPAAPSPEERT